MLASALTACGGDGGKSLDDFLPELPAPTGDAQAAFAGQVSSAEQLINGPATSGLVGDYFIRNDRARFVIQSEARVIGVVPQGGNLVDATLLDAAGDDVAPDHFGELSAIYLVGRTCEHESVEIVRDGSGGGAAVVVARGRSGVNDFINLKGIALLSVPQEIDPDIEDRIECATTYILHPGSPVLETYWTFFNADEELAVRGPFGALNDTGGETEAFMPTRGFERAGIDALTTLADPAPIDYVVYQGPGIAYGVVPRHADGETVNSALLIAGVSIVLYGVDKFLDILQEDHWFFQLEPLDGVTHRVDVIVGRDAADIEEQYQRALGGEVAELAGTVAFASGADPAGARVGVYLDADGNAEIGEDDAVVSYMDPDENGAFSGSLPPGNYLLRAEVKDLSRSQVTPVALGANGASGISLELPDPVVYDYRIIDDDSGNPIPGRLTVVGAHPVFPDLAVFETYDRLAGVVRTISSAYGTSVDLGAGADPQLVLPAGSTYRVFASRGTEWSVDSVELTPTADDGAELEFRLRHVVPTPGYLASEFHQHSVGSPDSPVGRPLRAATFAAEGVEFFASTDHDYVADFQPIVEMLGLERVVRAIPGLEVTPFVYGHFQAFPIELQDNDPTHGAIDWARGMEGFAMIPSEIWDTARSRGAEVIQINHPRSSSTDFSDMMQYFDRAGLVFDYDDRVIAGDLSVAPVPMEYLRLPEDTIWSDAFDALEVWNGFSMKDTNQDGVREIGAMDLVMRDWFNFLSFGLPITPMGNSDTHTVTKDPAGMPRTLVRVLDDSPTALESGSAVADVLDTLTGAMGAPKDVILTNGPHIEVEIDGVTGSPIGKVVDGTAGITLRVRALAPDWAAFDTIEVFVNATPNTREKRETWLQPSACFTSRAIDSLDPAEPCVTAPIPPAQVAIDLVEVAPGFSRYEAEVELALAAEDVALFNREGATGSDAWIVVRVRGQRAVFPLLAQGAISDGNLSALVSGDAAAVDAALTGIGIPAAALASPVYVDFDGSGYTAPFAP